MVAGSNPVAPTILFFPPTFTSPRGGAAGPDRNLPVVALISYQIADALVRVLPAPAADRLAVHIARAAFALRLPARAALEGTAA